MTKVLDTINIAGANFSSLMGSCIWRVLILMLPSQVSFHLSWRNVKLKGCKEPVEGNFEDAIAAIKKPECGGNRFFKFIICSCYVEYRCDLLT